jgi:hypothetical protein
LLPIVPDISRTDILDCLQSLKLHGCLYAPQFLAGLADSGREIQLRSVELAVEVSDNDEGSEQNLARFFQAFQCLQELYISITYSSDTYNGISGSIIGHRNSLQRLVYHEKKIIPIDSDDDYGSYEDDNNYLHRLSYKDVGIEPDQDITPFARDDFTRLLQDTFLECIGFCERPRALVCKFDGSINLKFLTQNPV